MRPGHTNEVFKSTGICRLNLLKALQYVSCAVFCLVLSGCIPTVEKTYAAPEASSILVYFYPEASDQFIPITGAKIYHQSHPEVAVYSDESGSFTLPAVVKTKVKLLMAGHALTYYPIVIEKDALSYIVLARASLHMRSLESIDFGSIILTQPAYLNTQDLGANVKSKWPCDQEIIENLDQSVATAQRLSTAFNGGLFASNNGYNRLVQHCKQLGDLLEVASGSCRWQEFNDAEQREKIRQTSEYFSGVQKILEGHPGYLDSLKMNNNSFFSQ